MRGKKILKNPKRIIRFLGGREYLNWIPDEIYLKMFYYSETNQKLNLNNPKTFNEKLQWLKLHDRKNIYSQYVDKFAVRSFIKEHIGEEYLVPMIGIFESVEEIDWEKLPNKFVLKCTHGSGGNIICTDKTKLNIKETKNKLNKWMKRNWYWLGREWPYKNVKPRIICEKFIEQDDGDELRDYRFFCFNGEPKFITVDFSITNKDKTRRNLYDLDWSLMEQEISYPKELSYKVKKPKKLEEMIDLARKISANIPHVRIDFYYINEKILFGEMTLYHQNGLGRIRPDDFNYEIGSWLELPK
ncbi:ATP-grasp fold amidoligase family protein [Gracilibacillus sp. HCP3S3_G5_1]|uniref:ATP-grasp fold amidoligase family protein n=1 Tax=unclassified Gracilibacillus TaxID=2625209 RepID=UPI003F8B4674